MKFKPIHSSVRTVMPFCDREATFGVSQNVWTKSKRVIERQINLCERKGGRTGYLNVCVSRFFLLQDDSTGRTLLTIGWNKAYVLLWEDDNESDDVMLPRDVLTWQIFFEWEFIITNENQINWLLTDILNFFENQLT